MGKRKELGWGWTIFWCIFFWPVGICLVIKKLPLRPKSITIAVIAWFIIIFTGVLLLTEFTRESGVDGVNIFIFLLFGIGGVLLLRKSSKVKKTLVRYTRYMDILNGGVAEMDVIASSTSLPYNTVVKDLQKMIDQKYLQNAYLDHGNRRIVHNKYLINQPVSYYTSVVQSQEETKSLRCPGCGAHNVVKVDDVSECEYCGTPIDSN